MLLLSKVLNVQMRLFSKIAPTKILEPLNAKSLIRIKGNDSQEFLQGIITNDIHHLGKTASGAMYTMFLNTKGRVLYDAIIYKIADDIFFIECDSEIEKSLEKHLKLYRVRRKIDVSGLSGDYQVHVISSNESTKGDCSLKGICTNETSHENLMIFKDPRVADLGYRILSRSEADVRPFLNDLLGTDLSDSSTNNYKTLRYSLGVGEGVNDLPVGSSFPLECNCDYLHGLSFHKGCYIGQELTARTHYTGVVRKRLMPLYFQKPPPTYPSDNSITSENINLGKLRGIAGNFGLALLRIDQAMELGEFRVGGENAKVIKPHWWPVTLPKEKSVIQKSRKL